MRHHRLLQIQSNLAQSQHRRAAPRREIKRGSKGEKRFEGGERQWRTGAEDDEDIAEHHGWERNANRRDGERTIYLWLNVRRLFKSPLSNQSNYL